MRDRNHIGTCSKFKEALIWTSGEEERVIAYSFGSNSQKGQFTFRLDDIQQQAASSNHIGSIGNLPLVCSYPCIFFEFLARDLKITARWSRRCPPTMMRLRIRPTPTHRLRTLPLRCKVFEVEDRPLHNTFIVEGVIARIHELTREIKHLISQTSNCK